MKAERFIGNSIDQLEVGLSQILAHALAEPSASHIFSFRLVDLDIASIRCSSCRVVVLTGSREFVGAVHSEWSTKSDSWEART